jgi:hypothetical protein
MHVQTIQFIPCPYLVVSRHVPCPTSIPNHPSTNPRLPVHPRPIAPPSCSPVRQCYRERLSDTWSRAGGTLVLTILQPSGPLWLWPERARAVRQGEGDKMGGGETRREYLCRDKVCMGRPSHGRSVRELASPRHNPP